MKKKLLIHMEMFKRLVTVSLVVMCSHVAAANRVGEVVALSDTLQLYPEVDYQQLTLTIIGDEVRWEEIFGPNEIAEFSNLVANFPDGQYLYELIASPNLDPHHGDLAESDRESTLEMERLERTNTFQQSGQFVIEGGVLFLEKDVIEIQSFTNTVQAEEGQTQ